MDNAILISSRVRPAGSLLTRTDPSDACPLHGADSAIYALTDFELDFPITVDMQVSIDDALGDMERLGIHALLVVSYGLSDQNTDVVGLVTAYAIERARHRWGARSLVSGSPGRVSVGYVMTPWDDLSLVKYESLRSLTALEVYEMFQGTGLTHLLVVGTHSNGKSLVRGVLSRAAVAKRIGRAPRVAARP